MEKLAFGAGLSKEAIRSIERAEKDPRYTTLFQIAEPLRIKLSTLVDILFKERSSERKKTIRKQSETETVKE